MSIAPFQSFPEFWEHLGFDDWVNSCLDNWSDRRRALYAGLAFIEKTDRSEKLEQCGGLIFNIMHSFDRKEQTFAQFASNCTRYEKFRCHIYLRDVVEAQITAGRAPSSLLA